MSKDDAIEVAGTVVAAERDANFKVQLDMGPIIDGYIAGKMRINNIRVIPGDKVSLEMSPYDLTRGRIVRREKLDPNKGTGRETAAQNNYSGANIDKAANSGLNQNVALKNNNYGDVNNGKSTNSVLNQEATLKNNNYSDINNTKPTNSGFNQDIAIDNVKQEHENYAQ